MSGSLHPSEITLLDYARGALKPGGRVLLDCHLETCAACRADVEALEAAGGVLMQALDPAALQEHALERALASIERPAPPPAPEPFPLTPDAPILKGVQVPRALRRAEIGPARWMAPGVRMAKLRGAGAGEAAYLLRVAPGMKLPDHGHTARELTLVLKGSFEDLGGVYRAGDLAEAGPQHEHQPAVIGEGDCVCLVAAEGTMRMREWLPRLLQPLLGV